MSDDSPFTITLYDKSLKKLRTVGAPAALVPTIRHNQQSTAILTVSAVPNNSSRLADLLADGTRVVIAYRGDFLMSGAVTGVQAKGPARESAFTFTITDDYAVVGRLLASPSPGTAAASGSDIKFTSEYDTRKDLPAETVLKGIVNANKGRLSIPGIPDLYVAPDQGRGSNVTVASRFSALDDKLLSQIDAAGIGISVRQLPDGSGGQRLVLDVYERRTYPRVISEASGAIQEWSLDRSAPKATRVWVAGPGVGVDRVFTPVVDTITAARIGYVVEAVLDATDTGSAAERVLRGLAFINENRETNGISVTLLDTPNLRFTPSLSPTAKGLRVGDVLTMRVGTTLEGSTEVGVGTEVTDVLRSVTLAWTATNGLTVTPQVGDVSDSLNPAHAVIRSMWRGFNALRTR